MDCIPFVLYYTLYLYCITLAIQKKLLTTIPISSKFLVMHIYPFPADSDITGIRRPFDEDDDQAWQERRLYARRHEGLFKSRLEQMQEEWLEDQENPELTKLYGKGRKLY